MDIFTVVAKVLEQALIAWNHHEKFAFIKKLTKLKMAYEKEFDKPSWSDREDYPKAKPSDFRDYRILHDYERELFVISEEYIARIPLEKGV